MSGGKDLLLQIEDSGSPGTFNTVAGLRSKSMSINAEAIDITDHDSLQFRELLDGCGIRSMSLSGSGVFKDAATLNQATADCIAQTLRKFRIIHVGFKTFEASFKITSLERAGEYNAEQTYSLSMESSGAFTVV